MTPSLRSAVLVQQPSFLQDEEDDGQGNNFLFQEEVEVPKASARLRGASGVTSSTLLAQQQGVDPLSGVMGDSPVMRMLLPQASPPFTTGAAASLTGGNAVGAPPGIALPPSTATGTGTAPFAFSHLGPRIASSPRLSIMPTQLPAIAVRTPSQSALVALPTSRTSGDAPATARGGALAGDGSSRRLNREATIQATLLPGSSATHVGGGAAHDAFPASLTTTGTGAHHVLSHHPYHPAGPEANVPFFQQYRGGLRASVIAGASTYYVGIIDILGRWSFRRWAERQFKVFFLWQNSKGISVMDPDSYAARFRTRVIGQLIDGYVFKDYDFDQEFAIGPPAY